MKKQNTQIIPLSKADELSLKGLPPYIKQAVIEIAQREKIPITGITILGGRPYINVTGLDRKLQNLCEEKGYEFSIEVIPLKDPNPSEGDYLVGRRAILKLFDKNGFLQALKAIAKSGQLDKETLQNLKETFTYVYTGEGWACPKTCEAICYEWIGEPGHKVKGDVLIDNVIMMAERRATNRAKREATGTGLTSIEELGIYRPNGVSITEEVEELITEEQKKEIERLLESEFLTEEEKERVLESYEHITKEKADKWIEYLKQTIKTRELQKKKQEMKEQLLKETVEESEL